MVVRKNRVPAAVPIAYFLPLTAGDGSAPSSYLLAQTSALPSSRARWMIRSEVRSLGAHWRGGRDLQATEAPFARMFDTVLALAHNTAGSQQVLDVAERLPLDVLGKTPWADVGPPLRVAAYSAYSIILRSDTTSAEWPLPSGYGGIWRSARSLIWVDLDLRIRTERSALTRAVLAGFRIAHGGIDIEGAIRDGRGHEFDRGRFLSPEESRDRFDRTSLQFLDALLSHYFRYPLHAMRRDPVMAEVAERAQLHGRSLPEEWDATKRGALTKVLSEELKPLLEDVYQAVWNLPVHPELTQIAFSEFLADRVRGLVRDLRRPLDAAITEDLMGPDSHRSVGSQDRPPTDMPLDEMSPNPHPEPPDLIGDQILSETYSLELIARARLSLREREALEAKLQGLPFRELAEARGVSESTISNSFMRARRKLEAAMKRL